jgi:hypothetical protein
MKAAAAALLLLALPAAGADTVRETIGPMTITVPATWTRNVDATGTVNFVPGTGGGEGQSQYSFSKYEGGVPNQLDGHRLMWTEIKKNAGIAKAERSGKAGRFDWSETTAQERNGTREFSLRFYSTKEGDAHVCVAIIATSPALLQARVAEIEKILAAAKFAGTKLPPPEVGAAPAAGGGVPIVGSYIKVEVRFGGIGGSNMTKDHVLLFGNGIAVRWGVINGAIACYAALPVSNLATLPHNYGRWSRNDATGDIEVRWQEGPAWQMRRDGGSYSVDGRKLLALRPLEPAKFNGIYAYQPVGDAPSALALMPDGRFEAQNLGENLSCGGPRATRNGRGRYEVRQWTLILRFDDGTTSMLPLHIRDEENLAAVKKFWVKSYEFEPAR